MKIILALLLLVHVHSSFAQSCEPGVFLGRLSANPYSSTSTSNPHGRFGSEFSTTSINNSSGRWGSAHSPVSVANPYATAAPKIIAADGTYLGRLSTNRYAADSVSNPNGKYGSPYSPTSINNPHSKYGSAFSTLSPNNPHATRAPGICGKK